VTLATVLASLALVLSGPAPGSGARLPVCSNRTIHEVAKRAGCALGDLRCWASSHGYCNDWVERRLLEGAPAGRLELVPVTAAEVRRGDVALYAARGHYAFVERVVTDRSGRPVAVDLSEYNYGTCWVDTDLLVTDQYGTLHRRLGVPLGAVDGGFLRARPAAP
jgi:hypothetical protein